MESTQKPKTTNSKLERKPSHLIIVCCHAIYLGGPMKGLIEDEWLIDHFQRGETPTFTKHVKAGLRILDGDEEGVLVFLGATKRPATDLTEGESYLNLVTDNGFFGNKNITPAQLSAETHATDSYQNVLFSLLQFRVHTGVYPQKLTVITHEFKRERFLGCHFPALGLRAEDEDRVSLIGINPPEEVTPLREGDMYSVREELKGKRVKRGRAHGMERGLWVGVGLEGVVEELVYWDGGKSGNDLFPKMRELPWYRS
ncbi:hypothetical protein BJX70DRAFT_392272 [Aspergillus crustosus]